MHLKLPSSNFTACLASPWNGLYLVKPAMLNIAELKLAGRAASAVQVTVGASVPNSLPSVGPGANPDKDTVAKVAAPRRSLPGYAADKASPTVNASDIVGPSHCLLWRCVLFWIFKRGFDVPSAVSAGSAAALPAALPVVSAAGRFKLEGMVTTQPLRKRSPTQLEIRLRKCLRRDMMTAKKLCRAPPTENLAGKIFYSLSF